MGDFWDSFWFGLQVAWDNLGVEIHDHALLAVGVVIAFFVIWRLLSSPARK